jgi:hypothetical protein
LNSRKTTPDRLPPHHDEAEQAVIGCLIEDPKNVMPAIYRRQPDCFYEQRCRLVFNAACTLYSEDTPIDFITLMKLLKDTHPEVEVEWHDFFMACLNFVRSTANLSTYLEILDEKFEQRRIIQACTETVASFFENGVPHDTLKYNAQSELAAAFGAASSKDLPEITDAVDFEAKDLPEPAILIEGMLHKGSKLVFGGSSKSFKTWCLFDLAMSISTGTDWLGRHTTIGKVLYVNFEIEEFAWQVRLRKVAQAKQQAPALGMLHLWNLRGHAADFRSLIPKIIARAKNEGYSLIILDPLYKLYGNTDENSAGDIGLLLNEIERLAKTANAAVAFGAHFAKGNASSKDAIDRISGSGVFARDPDSILIFTQHEEPDCFALQPILRNFPPISPFVVRWNFPLMVPTTDLDPDKLKQARGKKKEHDPKSLLALIVDNDIDNPISITDWALGGFVPRKTLQGYLADMHRKGFIKTLGEGTTSRKYITNEGKAFVNS